MLENIDSIAIGVWIAVILIALGIFCGLFLLYLKTAERTKVQLAFCLMFLCFALSRAVLVYGDYFVVDLVLDDYINHMEILKIANMFNLLGLGFLIVVSEYAVFKGKDYFVFTIGFSVVTTIAMILQDYYQVQAVAGYAFYFAVFIPISWVYLGVKLPHARKNAMLILFGFLILGAGLILLSIGITEFLTLSLNELYLLSAALQVVGLLVMGLGVKRFYFPK